jgi:hypothetical protein
VSDIFEIRGELRKGGTWLCAARSWMQSNVQGGDTLCWTSPETVSLPFCQLAELALEAAAAAVAEDRRKQGR